MKLKSLVYAAAILLPSMGFSAVNVIAQNYALSPNQATSNPILFSPTTLAAKGTGVVAVGIFGVSDATLTLATPGTQAWQDAVASFTQFGATVKMGNATNTDGIFTATPGAQVGGTSFEGKNVYVVIGNGDTLAASNFAVVFKSTTTFLAEPTASVNAGLTDVAIGGAPGGALVLGSLDAAKVWYTAGPLANQSLSGFVAAGVPEPSAALFGACASMLVFVRRRR